MGKKRRKFNWRRGAAGSKSSRGSRVSGAHGVPDPPGAALAGLGAPGPCDPLPTRTRLRNNGAAPWLLTK
jgi:hypothetical protein